MKRGRISAAGGVFFLTVALLCPSYTQGQGIGARMTGVVTDASGAVLPGVTVTALSEGTNVRAAAVTNDTGIYTLVNLQPGRYEVRAELPGFKSYIHSGVTLQVEQVARIDIKMQVGELTENVQVLGEAPLLNTETSEKSSVISHEELIDLPLQGRDFDELAFLTVGVMPKNEGGQGGFANVNGARSDSINFIVEGGNNNILRGGAGTVRPSLDAIQEFKVQTSNYSAEYGRRSSFVINMALRSGTNALHGTLFHFHRNAVLDARNFFDVLDVDRDGRADKSKLIRNNFGGNLGGPIIRDKFFFFFNYEGMRRRQGGTRLAVVPTLLERQGNFSEFNKKLKDPLSGKKFKNNRIPADRIHPISRQIMEFYPLPNLDPAYQGFNFGSNKVDMDDFDDFVGKVDYYFGAGDTLTVRTVYNRRELSEPFAGSVLPGFGNTGPQRLYLLGITYTKTFSPTVINQALFNATRKKVLRWAANFQTDYAKVFGISGITQDAGLFGFPRVAMKDYAAIGDANNMPLDWVENSFQANDVLTITKGGHNLRMGGEMIRTQFSQLFANNARGVFSFQGRWTGQPFADFLLGLLNNSNRRIKQTKNYLFNTTFAGFVQDDWKVRRNLTLNLGLRYDLFLPPTDKFANWSNFVPGEGRIVLSGEEGFPTALVHADRNNFAPRIGFAWRPFGRNTTVLRAGYGIFFGTSLLNPLRLQLGANPPFTIRENFSRNSKKPLLLTWDSPFPSSRARIADVTSPSGYELRPNTAHLQQYNLTIEQQLAGDTVLEVGYVGSKGTHLGRQYNINQPDRSGGAAVLEALGAFPRPFEGFGTIDYFAFEADSNYHALQASLRKRGRDINYRINYVFSKSIDDASRLTGRASGGGFAGSQDSLNRHLERGLSDFDRRHGLVASIIYRMPFGRGLRGAAGVFLSGWQANSIVRLYSGTPLTPQLARFDFNLGEAKRPDRIGTGKLETPTPERWYRVEDFVPVASGAYRFGNSGRGIVNGPPQQRWSFSLMKHFTLPNEHRVQFRWEIFNLPNFTNFQMPHEFIDEPTAGVITRALAARQMQVALKYMF